MTALQGAAERWWAGRVDSPGRMTIVVGGVVRLSAGAVLLVALPMVAPRTGDERLAWLLGLGLLAGSAMVVAGWLAADRITGRTIAFDLVWNAAGLVLGRLLAPEGGDWSYFAYPYTVPLAFTLGLGCRRASSAVLLGLLWPVTIIAADLLNGVPGATSPAAALGIVPAYLANPLLGWACARLLSRAWAALADSEREAVRQAGSLAVARERAKHARALHDRVLQTLEALARPGWLTEAERARVADLATWLRRYVETGARDPSDNLAAALESTVGDARDAGLSVELNDASLRSADASRRAEPPPPARDALVASVRQILGCLPGGPVVVRAVASSSSDPGDLLVTVLADGPSPDPSVLDAVRHRLAGHGGGLTVSAGPHLELRLPAGGG
jgi:hypothetical protein